MNVIETKTVSLTENKYNLKEVKMCNSKFE